MRPVVVRLRVQNRIHGRAPSGGTRRQVASSEPRTEADFPVDKTQVVVEDAILNYGTPEVRISCPATRQRPPLATPIGGRLMDQSAPRRKNRFRRSPAQDFPNL